MEMEAAVWYRQDRLEDAASEALGALGIYERLRASKDPASCKGLLQDTDQQAMAIAGAGELPRVHFSTPALRRSASCNCKLYVSLLLFFPCWSWTAHKLSKV